MVLYFLEIIRRFYVLLFDIPLITGVVTNGLRNVSGQLSGCTQGFAWGFPTMTRSLAGYTQALRWK